MENEELSVNYRMVAKTMFGLEELLAGELTQLGAEQIEIQTRAVAFTGDKGLMYKANYLCRAALRVLKVIHEFDVTDEEDLYQKVKAINWDLYSSNNRTLAVDAVLAQSTFTHSQYIALKTKDAIVDYFRDLTGRRPDVDLDDPDMRVNVYVFERHVTLSLDSSGTSLHKRGYRTEVGLAPINEVLAAGLIMLTGWQADTDFVDPMCGSGTFLIEAAMMGSHIPSGYYRQSFGFQHWKDYDPGLWKRVVSQAAEEIGEFEFRIIGVDQSEKAIGHAKANLRISKLHKDVELHHMKFEDFDPPSTGGLMIMNPPYGERLKVGDMIRMNKTIGDTLKRKYAGFQAYVISSDLESLRFIGLRPSRKIKVYNGKLECRLLKFDVYEGTKRYGDTSDDPQDAPAEGSQLTD